MNTSARDVEQSHRGGVRVATSSLNLGGLASAGPSFSLEAELNRLGVWEPPAVPEREAVDRWWKRGENPECTH